MLSAHLPPHHPLFSVHTPHGYTCLLLHTVRAQYMPARLRLSLSVCVCARTKIVSECCSLPPPASPPALRSGASLRPVFFVAWLQTSR